MCITVCEPGAIFQNGDGIITDGEKCTLCGACVETCYAEAREIVGREMTVAQVMTEIEKDVAFYDQSGGGATFSGGEPLLQRDFLLDLLQACREKEIHTAVDTCGFVSWPTFEMIRPYVNLFLYDLKLMDDTKHRKFTGMSNKLILRNLQILSQYGHNIILRVPIIPGINNDQEHLHQLGDFAAALPRLNRVDILPYHHIGRDKYQRIDKFYELPDIQPPTAEEMGNIAEILQEYDLQVKTGG